jgi:hypothetical protein
MIRAFLLGIAEFRLNVTAGTDHPVAYDRGRELAHKITGRRYDS